ncbi:3-oxoacyl-ACP reductase [Kineococcus rhizosphaerae]|uniref:3-oxoacyl-[acyl-carrier protein] reductase n=1 Tax=Kineococcus rhizosphaerae TaxID=559628 RepID=A0A2T0R0C6_9ACTN|nr:3-oxoacyl-ACP reductase [Kineococcus rhizosphaerae]PRY12602.1 3-oxoacyl-[acyl-carrier protein] reductase [Kineococcus rhizosphaerae]
MSAMSDPYGSFVRTGPGKLLAARTGLPRPPRLRRSVPGQGLLDGPAAVVGLPGASRVDETTLWLRNAGVRIARGEEPLAALVVDATGLRTVADLDELLTLAPLFRRTTGRVLVLSAVPATLTDPEARAVQQGLEGFVRSLGKEARGGTTVNLLRVAEGAGTALRSAVEFFCSARSAFVDGQPLVVGPGVPVVRRDRPVAVVTGAAQGIGAATAQVLARSGHHVVCVDVAAAGEKLAAVANSVAGSTLHLDVTAADAPAALATHLADRFGGADVVVHNAGITRDRSFVNLDAAAWSSVLAVNLGAPVRLTTALLEHDGALAPGARFVCLSSINGLAGAKGQTNYATSKAGLVGLVEALAGPLAERGLAVNAVAPGFIETPMTAAMPPIPRELGRRTSSLQQGGLPIDVAEAIGWLAQPDAAGIDGQVLRVCGQNLLGA